MDSVSKPSRWTVETTPPEVVLDDVRSRLEKFGRIEQRHARDFMARCPVHDDRRPSLHVEAKDKRVVLYCFAGCAEEAVADAIGLTIQDLFYEQRRYDEPVKPRPVPRRAEPTSAPKQTVTRSYATLRFPSLGMPATVYEYRDAAGVLLYVVARYQTESGKEFRRFVPAPDGRWIRKGPDPAHRVLYRLPELRTGIDSGSVPVLVEGEKDADTGAKLGLPGLVFTSADGGANAPWQPQYTDELRDAGIVRIIRDRDDAGRKYAARVAGELGRAGLRVEVFESDRGKDWTEHVEKAGGWSDLVPVLEPVENLPGPLSEDQSEDVEVNDFDLWEGWSRGDGPRYRVVDHRIYQFTRERRENGEWGSSRRLVLGADVRIVEEIWPSVLDDAVESDGKQVTHYVLRAVRDRTDSDTGEVRVEETQFTVDLKEWRDGSWLERYLGAGFQGGRDRTSRARICEAIDAVSSSRRVKAYAATGWTEIDGKRAYIHSGGAITADRVVPVRTMLPVVMQQEWSIEAPSVSVTGDLLESVGMVSETGVWSWLPSRIGFATAGVPYRSILPGNALTVMLVDSPKTGKTEISMIAMEHFAPKLRHENKRLVSMGGGGATVKAAQKIMHAAKDAALLIDDFPAKASAHDVAAGKDQSTMVRQVYDQQARYALTQDGEQRGSAPSPRCAVLTSAEYAPDEKGARERCVIVPMPPWRGDLPVTDIRRAQSATAARARSRFFGWVIQQTAARGAEELEEWTGDEDARWAQILTSEGFSERNSELVGKLLTGWSWVIGLLEAAGVWTSAQKAVAMSQVWEAAVQTCQANEFESDELTADAWLVRLMTTALGRGHVADAANPAFPPGMLDPVGCGWSPVAVGQDTVWRPQGTRLGYVRGDRLLLERDAIFAAVQRVAADEGGPLPAHSIGAVASILAGASVGFQTDVGRSCRRALVAGRRAYVWDLPVSLFWPGTDDGDTQVPPPPPGDVPSPGSPLPPVEDLRCEVCGEPIKPIDGVMVHPSCDQSDTPPEEAKPVRETQEWRGRAAEPRWRYSEAVVTAAEVILPDGKRIEATFSHAGELAMWAGEMGIGSGGGKTVPEPAHLWLTRDFLEAHGLPVGMDDHDALDSAIDASRQTSTFWTEAAAEGYKSSEASHGGWIRVWKQRSRASAVLTSTEWMHLHALDQDKPDPEHLAYRLGMWTTLVGRPISFNEGYTFKHFCQLKGMALPDLPWEKISSDFLWQRPLDPPEKDCGWIHCYDRRKSYLAACTAVSASEELAHFDHPTIDVKRAGFWRVSSTTWPENGFELPDPRLDYDGGLCEWVSTPILELMLEHSQVEVSEAWLYEGQRSRVLYPAYEAVRGALEAAEAMPVSEDVSAVIQALKASYRVGVGQMAMGRHVRAGAPAWGYRPDVRAAVISVHRANSLRAMIWAGTRSWPLAMTKSDSVLFASSIEDPVAAWPGRPEDISEKLGKYKPAGTVSMEAWAELALVEPVSPARSLFAVTNRDYARRLLSVELEDDDG